MNTKPALFAELYMPVRNPSPNAVRGREIRRLEAKSEDDSGSPLTSRESTAAAEEEDAEAGKRSLK